MNKQELIRELKEEKRKIEWKEDKYELHNAASGGKERAYSLAIDLAKKLDEPEKVVVPQFVADWFEDNFEELDWELGGVLINAFNTNRNERSDFQDWLVDTTNYPIETLIRMKLFDYKVETEPLYYVKLPEIGYMRFGYRYFYSEDVEEAKKYTEQEIKAIDERYWPFAVKVEGE
ncbi:TPA: DUF1642 domain-containing protein [Enterococcus faecalis]|nr:DUF1642 domain-containing protein [Enterococcus faecalis]HBD0829344.1 DUF1642 domain-containing protein [Enterococcus faecalis]HBD0833366.1 DUF1642 domain-containing protein [Enterococcus faecalis]HBD0858933.1 DUF1642 domain-containing protein [Enterococcus faecalis]